MNNENLLKNRYVLFLIVKPTASNCLLISQNGTHVEFTFLVDASTPCPKIIVLKIQ